MTRTIQALALTLALTLAAAPALADGGPRRGPPPPLSALIVDHADALGLDEPTLDRVLALLDAREPALRAMHDALRAQAEVGGAPDREAVEAAHEAGRALLEEVEALLTAEQVEALRALLPPPPGGDRPPCAPPQGD